MNNTQPSVRGSARVNLAFTQAGEDAARRLQSRFDLPSLVEVGRIGVAFALRENLPIERPETFGTTSGANYNVGSVDPQSELKNLLTAIRPDAQDDAYRVIETLMTVGTIAIDREVSLGRIVSLRDLVDPGRI
ncbi:hypothetical protein [Amycolatopsis sp. cmx-4-68]|uniref:hypothetical protein n=1 Tax=Amycolatopsis sp. cmx-4-68 TaxID=2790938 RepID=UPI003978369D